MATRSRCCTGCKCDLSAKPYKGKLVRLPPFTSVQVVRHHGGGKQTVRSIYFCPACTQTQAMPIVNDVIASILA